jgi:hypothetical protein
MSSFLHLVDGDAAAEVDGGDVRRAVAGLALAPVGGMSIRDERISEFPRLVGELENQRSARR